MKQRPVIPNGLTWTVPKPSGRRPCRALVAQICNLPYRRFEIGRAWASPNAFDLADTLQAASLRYGRLRICATIRKTLGQSAVLVCFFLSLAVNTSAHTLPLSFLKLVPDADYLHLELTFNPFELTFFSELDANKDRRLDSSEWEAQPGNATRRITDCLKVSVNGKPVTAEVAGIIPDFDSHHATLRAHYAVDARHGEVRVVSSLAALTSGSHFTQVTFGREGGVQSARLDAHSAAATFGKTNETGAAFPPHRESSVAARLFPAALLALGALLGLAWLVRRGTSWHLFGAERGHPGRSGSAPHGSGKISEPAAKWRLLRPGRPRSAEQMPALASTNRLTQTHPPAIESRRIS